MTDLKTLDLYLQANAITQMGKNLETFFENKEESFNLDWDVFLESDNAKALASKERLFQSLLYKKSEEIGVTIWDKSEKQTISNILLYTFTDNYSTFISTNTWEDAFYVLARLIGEGVFDNA